MGGRGRLGGPAGRRDRASDRRREMADLTYDGSAPSACALLQQASALRYRLRLNALEPRVRTNMVACGRSVRTQPSGWRSDRVREGRRESVPRFGRCFIGNAPRVTDVRQTGFSGKKPVRPPWSAVEKIWSSTSVQAPKFQQRCHPVLAPQRLRPPKTSA